MSGWEFILVGLVVAGGALCFLRIVANEIEMSAGYLRRREQAEKRRAQRRQQEEAAQASGQGVLSVEAA